MVTVNPARALRYENALGQIRPGFGADLIAVPCSTSTDIFEQILAFDAPVSWSMVNGNACSTRLTRSAASTIQAFNAAKQLLACC